MPSSIQKTELLPSKKIYYIKDTETATSRTRLTLRRWWEKGYFPKPTLINGRLAWGASIVEQWIETHLQGAAKHDQQ